MIKIAFVCPPLLGHINPMKSIAQCLDRKKFHIIFIGVLDIAKYFEKLKYIEYIPLGAAQFPLGSIQKIIERMSKLKGIRMGRLWQSQFTKKWSEVVCRDLRFILEWKEIDFIICDQLEPAIGLVADYLNIPFITICNAMAIIMDLSLPPFFTRWDYKITKRRLVINEGFYKVAEFILKRDTKVLEYWRKKWGMEERNGMRRYFAYSDIATLSQQTKSLEFPLTDINKNWHYCGPFRTNGTLDYPKLEIPKDNVKNVYISLGSMQGSRYKLLKKCVNSCLSVGARPLVVHGGLLDNKKIKKLKTKALVFDFLKQPEIFEVCEVLISHCGLNTGLDALSYGRPIIAIPLGIEQGAIATKFKRAGFAIICKRPKKRKLKKALIEILSNSKYQERSQLLKFEIKNSGGVEKAVEIITYYLDKHIPKQK
jgi:UDP:flavonoid glycosyltransferase YjiC (YdhE family)